ncbi:23S rRNA (cytidine1920-2'-O)/16S rRNA (cytidine1409-2'-O)-methyltransferase [Corynebacterium mycetoides]|uniref:23S rRNA (Cytidine1920-2'-O)/16S rRNA (Cytidine1409-2'-O)-methyltransferase n=1 Tax=Corynebacterium mycetoides TaxID=38302 RepID=A0A1G9M7D2_9CORY|nr:TlyA family RNA methyltransferase [Corynebacterium mycetoides]SDL70190.1 23S rRNA (cytidine1920-2'-O)/16S rRNA (cytidine1409-2'-O)-methyltransferase [Corynebacterium mycetoides]
MAPGRRRLDAELVRRKLARSREQAQAWIKDGRVTVGGFAATKPATVVEPDVSIKVNVDPADDWASRGAHKLLGALEEFEGRGLSVEKRRALDAGASTGGFTDVLLSKGASEVVAVDVGYGQLVWRLQNDPRVRVLDRTNIRTLTPEMMGGPADLMVGDLSFISLELVLPAVVACVAEGADLLPMVKPQFEVGKERLGHGGVVRSRELRAEVTADVARFAQSLGLSLRGVVASPLPGPSGNVEYFLWLVKDAGASQLDDASLTAMVARAVEEGPE